MSKKRITIELPMILYEKLEKRKEDTWTRSITDYLIQLIKIDVQKKILK